MCCMASARRSECFLIFASPRTPLSSTRFSATPSRLHSTRGHSVCPRISEGALPGIPTPFARTRRTLVVAWHATILSPLVLSFLSCTLGRS